MLPNGFHWRSDTQGDDLYFGERRVAFSVEASPDGAWRLALAGRPGPPRYEFLATRRLCKAYMIAWAIKWETEIRKHGTENRGLNAGTGR